MEIDISLEEFNRIIENTFKEFQTKENQLFKLIAENCFIEIISQLYSDNNNIQIKDLHYIKKYKAVLYVFQNYDLNNYSYDNYLKFNDRKENFNCKQNQIVYPQIILEVISDIFLDNNKEENKFWNLYLDLFLYPLTSKKYDELIGNTQIWNISRGIYSKIITNKDNILKAFKFVELNHILKFNFTSLLAKKIESNYLNYSYLEIFKKMEIFFYLSRLPLFGVDKEIIEGLIDKSYKGEDLSCFIDKINDIENKLNDEINMFFNKKQNSNLPSKKSFNLKFQLDSKLEEYIIERINSGINDIKNIEIPKCNVYNFYFWQFLRNEYKNNAFIKCKFMFWGEDGKLTKINEELEQVINRSFWNDSLVDCDNTMLDEFVKIFEEYRILNEYRLNNNFFTDRRNDIPIKEYKAFFPLFDIVREESNTYRVEYDYYKNCYDIKCNILNLGISSQPYPKKIIKNIVE